MPAAESQLTIMVPTYNRPDFLERLLAYYDKVGCPYTIAIADSSTGDHAAAGRRHAANYHDKLRIEYLPCPEFNDAQAIKAMIEALATPYAVFIGDDDALVPRGLKACVDFLQENPDYSAAHGEGVFFSVDGDAVYGNISGTFHYRQPVLEQPLPSQRLIEHLSRYSVSLFSVHRSETWKAMYKNIEKIQEKSFTEILPSCLTVVEGKVRNLDVLYLFRQVHSRRYLIAGIWDQITSATWQPSYAVFAQTLADELACREPLSTDQAQTMVKEAFRSYLAIALDGKEPAWKTRIKSIPAVGPLAQKTYSLFKSRSKMDLKDFLDKKSKYYGDFLPFYEIVTHPELVL